MDHRRYTKTNLKPKDRGMMGVGLEGQRIGSSDKRLKISPRVTGGAGWNTTLPVPGNFQKPGLWFGFGFWKKGRMGEKPDILLSIYYELDIFQTLSH